MNPYQIIIRPIDTEKTRYQASELGQYTFEVDRRANKIQIKQAIEAIYGVDVVAVNVMNMPAKVIKRRGRRRVVRRSPWKKAVVTLAEDQRLGVFEGV
ncbi:MAG: 50S ribosomal protein L23 [Chloroflexi bacterium]|nr:MAG: 50S ribosomal protein L23 [Chloroflexota bacterium]RLC92393.1 MAG: 50S ribosomal protein L23 [Chloroflexota bacterium]HEY66939.1 50S ribosomal protein L23 [Thermoflexia bacterium]